MNNVWVSIAIILNVFSMLYLYILSRYENSDDYQHTELLTVLSASGFLVSFIFFLPHLETILHNTTLATTILLIMYCAVAAIGCSHLWVLLRRTPTIKPFLVKLISTFVFLGILYNHYYNFKLSLFILRGSSIGLILLSIACAKHYILPKKLGAFSLGLSYIVSGVLLQSTSLFLTADNTQSLSQTLIISSAPLILYGFEFMIAAHNSTMIQKQIQALDEAEKALYVTRNFDPMTGLKNKMHFDEDIKRLQVYPESAWAGLINIDNFRKINEVMGHHGGDQIICDLGAALSEKIEPKVNLYRFSGDRFAYMLSGCEQDSISTTRKLQSLMNTFSRDHDLPIQLTASIGITNITPSKSLENIHQELELSMTTVSYSTKNSHVIYHVDLLKEYLDKVAFEKALKNAARNDAWTLHFQPQVYIDTGEICGAEILIRWEKEEGQLLNPGEFIPIAESIGLMNNIGRAVIQKSFETIQRFNEKGYPQMRYAINLSGEQFEDNALYSLLKKLKAQHHIPDNQIVLEICETVFVKNFNETESLLHRFHEAGFEVALDDFGTGYSSLQYLARLPIQEIKFDRSFVKDLGRFQKSNKILRKMIQLAHELDLRHVIEGVETKEQEQLIYELGGNCCQGFYFSKPIDLVTFENALNAVYTDKT